MAANPPETYRQYYDDPSNDPYGGDFVDMMAEFRTEDQPPAGPTLRDTIGSADVSVAAAFLMIRENLAGEPVFHVLHGVSKYPTLAGRRTAWDGKLFAFSGDIVEGLITSVTFPDNAFNLTGYHNVPTTLARARELLEQNPGEVALGPFQDTDAQVRSLRTRQLVPLPAPYVPLFLDKEVPLREGFIDLSAVIEANNHDCDELVNWLLVAITRDTPGGITSLKQAAPSVPHADRQLHKHRRSVLLSHLTGRSNPSNANQAAATQQRLADSVSEMVAEQRMARTEATARADKTTAPKTVAKALGKEICDTLLVICQVTEEAQLPGLWRDVADAGKRDRQALEHALMAKARSLHMAEVAPVATPDLVKKVTGLQWAGLSVDDLSEGLQPFALVLHDYVGSEAGVEAQRLADTYDILVSTNTTSTIQDAQTVKTSKAIIPMDFSEARAHLVALMVLWTVLLGDDHPFVLAYGRFVQMYTAREYSFQSKLRSLGTAAPPAALLLRFVQLRMVTYWRKAISYRMLPTTPNFEELLDKLEMQDTSWIPTLPLKYWKPLVNPGPASGSVSSGLTWASTLTPSTTSSGADSTSQNAAPSGGTTGPSPNQERRNQEFDKNPAVKAIFEPFAEQIKKGTIKDAIARGGVPPTVERNGKKVPMCASYHLKGSCWSGCARGEDHGPHSDEEDNLLLNWCQAAYAP